MLQLHAPDKRDAMKIIIRDSHALLALVEGDSDNDESTYKISIQPNKYGCY